jgi:hypothetical protein
VDSVRVGQTIGSLSLGAVVVALIDASISVHADNVAMNGSDLLCLPLVLATALVAGGAVALLSSSVLAHVAARGAVWLVFVSASYAMASTFFGSDVVPGFRTTVLAVGSGVALAASRPELTRLLARSDFAPIAYRRWFLVGVVSAMACATTTAIMALSATTAGEGALGLLLASLAASLVAASAAVLRMRAWGVLVGVGAATLIGIAGWLRGCGLTAAALHPGWPDSVSFLFVVVPVVALGLPIVLARLRARA